MLLSTDTFLAPGSAPERLWLNRFAGLGPTFYSHVAAAPLRDPYWVARNDALAREMGLEYACLAIVANWAAGCGAGEEITMDEVLANVAAASAGIPALIATVARG